MSRSSTALMEAIRDAADKQVRFIMDHREELISAWVAETGCLPSESVLVEKRQPDGTVVVYIRKRTESDA